MRHTMRRPGLTLIDLVVTLMVLAIMSGVAIPRYADAMLEARVRAAARLLAADLSHARRYAVATGASQAVMFDTASDSYVLSGLSHPDRFYEPYQIALSEAPYQAVLASASPAMMVFNPYGRPASSGSFVVEVGAKSRTVSVDPVSGRVEVTR